MIVFLRAHKAIQSAFTGKSSVTYRHTKYGTVAVGKFQDDVIPYRPTTQKEKKIIGKINDAAISKLYQEKQTEFQLRKLDEEQSTFFSTGNTGMFWFTSGPRETPTDEEIKSVCIDDSVSTGLPVGSPDMQILSTVHQVDDDVEPFDSNGELLAQICDDLFTKVVDEMD
jgi:hypothetical protein